MSKVSIGSTAKFKDQEGYQQKRSNDANKSKFNFTFGMNNSQVIADSEMSKHKKLTKSEQNLIKKGHRVRQKYIKSEIMEQKQHFKDKIQKFQNIQRVSEISIEQTQKDQPLCCGLFK